MSRCRARSGGEGCPFGPRACVCSGFGCSLSVKSRFPLHYQYPFHRWHVRQGRDPVRRRGQRTPSLLLLFPLIATACCCALIRSRPGLEHTCHVLNGKTKTHIPHVDLALGDRLHHKTNKARANLQLRLIDLLPQTWSRPGASIYNLESSFPCSGKRFWALRTTNSLAGSPGKAASAPEYLVRLTAGTASIQP